MVRYLTATDTIYTRWAHSFDSYGSDPSSKTVTFLWEASDIWTKSTPDELVAEVRAFQALRSPNLPFPVDIYPDLKPPSTWGFSGEAIQLALRAKLHHGRGLLRLGSGDAPAGSGKFIVRGGRMVVEFARVTAVTVHLDDTFAPADADEIAGDLCALCALAFEHFGQLGPAGLLAASYLPDSVLLSNPNAVGALAGAMAASRQLLGALDLAETLDEADDPRGREASLLLLLVLLAQSQSLSPREVRAYRETLQQRIARRERRKEAEPEARESMNLAQFEKATGEPETAMALYRKVIELDPAYANRAHYWRERGGAAFLSAQRLDFAARIDVDAPSATDLWAEAVNSYERTVAFNDLARDRALLGDALLYSGRYADALAAFAEFNAGAQDDEPRDDEWKLKEIVLQHIVDDLGIPRQDRRPYAGERGGDSSDATELEDALRLDALGGLPWFNLGASRIASDDRLGAAVAFLAAALIMERDPQAWARAFIWFFDQGELTLLPPLLTTGERLTGGRWCPRSATAYASRRTPSRRRLSSSPSTISLTCCPVISGEPKCGCCAKMGRSKHSLLQATWLGHCTRWRRPSCPDLRSAAMIRAPAEAARNTRNATGRPDEFPHPGRC
jgi:tetratricopeptide (TPR) repeat protein